MVAEITAISIKIPLSLFPHHLIAVAVIAVSILAVLPLIAVAIR
jgi:hypothetical protein